MCFAGSSWTFLTEKYPCVPATCNTWRDRNPVHQGLSAMLCVLMMDGWHGLQWNVAGQETCHIAVCACRGP